MLNQLSLLYQLANKIKIPLYIIMCNNSLPQHYIITVVSSFFSDCFSMMFYFMLLFLSFILKMLESMINFD